jgi:hypothetical protein
MTKALNIDTLAPSPIPRGTSAGEQRTPLYEMCFFNLPKHRKVSRSLRGNEWRGLDIDKIALSLDVSKQKVSLWMKKNMLPGQRVTQMINLPGSTLTYEKLGPFINTR